jgi:hypothetical protein
MKSRLILHENGYIMSDLIGQCNEYRARMNEVNLSKDNLVMKWLWNLDTRTRHQYRRDV